MPRLTPYQALHAALRDTLGDDADRLPKKWERLGDVVVVRLPAEILAAHDPALLGKAYADVLGARLVLHDDGGVQGELREPTMRRLWGDGSAETEHTENGIRYRLDAEHIMWSSGNVDERIRLARLDAADDTVVDLFAGIGYYTLPLLVHAGAARAIACEKNPRAARYLRENAEANGVADRLDVREGDCREVCPTHVADRVVLGYFPGCRDFLPTGLAALGPEGGIVHYHDTAKADTPERELLTHMLDALQQVNLNEAHPGHLILEEHTFRVVKSYAPGVVHAVLDAEVRPV